MKCMCKQARSNKYKLETERANEKEKARWNSLTPEEQERELADKAKRSKRAVEKAFTLGAFVSAFNGSYDKFR